MLLIVLLLREQLGILSSAAASQTRPPPVTTKQQGHHIFDQDISDTKRTNHMWDSLHLHQDSHHQHECHSECPWMLESFEAVDQDDFKSQGLKLTWFWHLKKNQRHGIGQSVPK